jgi:hypothetical protein
LILRTAESASDACTKPLSREVKLRFEKGRLVFSKSPEQKLEKKKKEESRVFAAAGEEGWNSIRTRIRTV